MPKATLRRARPLRETLRRNVSLAVLAGFALALSPLQADPLAAQTTPARAPAAAPAVTGDFTEIVERMSPTVVAITTRRVVERERAQLDPDDVPPPLREFFGRRGQAPGVRPPQQRQARALGSGFFISGDGHIVTNNHVIAEAQEIQVMFGDGETRSAELVGADPATDLAVLRIEDPPQDIAVAPWGDSDAMVPGAWTIAIGSPFGLGGTVTVGVLSARSRDIRTGPYDDYLQTDAAINQGNSGGPLFNREGEVIGVNTAIFSPTGASVGIGFAVPSRTASRIVEELIQTGLVQRGFVGIRLQELTPALARAFGLDREEGAVVVAVEPGSPAQEAGMQPGDVVLRLGDQEVTGSRALTRMVADIAPGTETPVTVHRAGEEVEIAVTIGLREPQEPVRTGALPDEVDEQALGLALSPIPDALRSQLGLEDEEPAVVQRVEPGGPAAEAGMLRGDVIVEIDNRPLAGPGDVAEAWRAARQEERPLLMRVLRNGNPLYVAVDPTG